MSTSLHSGRARLLAAALFAVGLVAPGGDVWCQRAFSKLSADQTQTLTTSVRRLAETRDDMPANRQATVRWSEPPGSISSGSGRVIVAVALIRFSGLANSYCRLVASDRAARDAVFVPVPVEANFDGCRKAGPTRIADIDGDGVQDLMFTVTLQSNRSEAQVQEVMVFLRKAGTPSGYCYSQDASKLLAPDDLRTADTALAAGHRALARLGKERFACSKS